MMELRNSKFKFDAINLTFNCAHENCAQRRSKGCLNPKFINIGHPVFWFSISRCILKKHFTLDIWQ